MSCSRLPSLRLLPLALASLLVGGLAQAGPTNPGMHAFERVAPSGPAAVALQRPGTNRVLLIGGGGEVVETAADGLYRRELGTLPVDDGCPGPAVFAAQWDPDAPGERLYLSYQAEGTGSMSIGRLDLEGFVFEQVFDSLVGSGCQNVGGGLAFASDGTLLLGVGDHGAPAAATSTSARAGKILRVTVDGAPPMPPLDTNPLNPASPFYAMGVRNPVAIATEPFDGMSWFLDVGPPGGSDEINLVQPLTNHGWSGLMVTGRQDLPGDPHHVWDPAIGVSGLVSDELLQLNTLGRGLVVSAAGTGEIHSVNPDPADPLNSSSELLYSPDPGGPQALTAPAGFVDSSLQVLGDDGQLWRLRLKAPWIQEPSRVDSVVPSLLTKDGAGGYELAAERVARDVAYGLHVGDLMTLRDGYTHSDAPDRALDEEADSGDARSRWALSEDDLGGAGNSVYYLIGAADNCTGSGLGIDSGLGSRPGGSGLVEVGSLPLLGSGTHDIANVDLSTILVRADGLNVPRDLEFHPDVSGELWIVNRQDDSTVIITDTNLPSQSSRYVWTPSGNHFLAQPSALAFGPGTRYFATSHEEDDFTQGPPPAGTPADFMGPTLWTNESAIYEGGHASHFDMLHNSPNGAGIAWESGSAYWIFDGWNQSLTRYNFNDDHGLGGSDHTDGEIDRYAEGLVSYVPDVPSHMVWDHDADVLLVADTGNNRIAVFDPSTAVNDRGIGPNYDGCTMRGMSGGTLTTLIDGNAHGLVAPSGLEVNGCLLYVTDNATSTIHAFTREGTPVDYLETGLPAGSLMGMAFDPRDDSLYIVDAIADEILRIAPR